MRRVAASCVAGSPSVFFHDKSRLKGRGASGLPFEETDMLSEPPMEFDSIHSKLNKSDSVQCVISLITTITLLSSLVLVARLTSTSPIKMDRIKGLSSTSIGTSQALGESGV